VASGLPEQARATVARAMGGAPGLMLGAWDPGGSESVTKPASSGQDRGSDQDRGSNQGRGSDQGSGAAPPDNGQMPKQTPKPDRTPKPEPTQRADERGAPEAIPRGQATGHARAP
jgi:hypothetical protein